MIPKFTDGFFEISSEHGFLPKKDPLVKLPEKYSKLQILLDNMSITKEDGTKGLLGNGNLLEEECYKLPDYTDSISGETDVFVLTALYRSYCFLASAYLLEPAYNSFLITGKYGIARDKLPVNISQPLIKVASILDIFPFLEYSYGYSLGNYVRLDKDKGLEWDNLGMANKFSGASDEAGFIMVHVDINRHTPSMIGSVNSLLRMVYKCFDTDNICNEISKLVGVLKDMNDSRKQMWKASRSNHYNDFRVFIMGIKGNTDIFPNGVIYEPEIEARYYRGQSGSQDTIIPFLDTVFHIDDHYPDNMLTKYLLDMRFYRPKPFRDLLDWCKSNLAYFINKLIDMKNVSINLELYKIYREIYRFRNGHWQFIQKYIMENTKYPVATGGTPITTWVPNQILATLNAMNRVLLASETLEKTECEKIRYEKYLDEYNRMRECLEKQIEELRKPEYRPDSVFELNANYKLNDI